MSARPFKITVGDRKTSIAYVLRDDGFDNDLSAATVTFSMYDSAGTAVVSAASCTVQPTYTFTVDSTADTIKVNGHPVQDEHWELIFSNSGGALPAGLSASTRYFARDITPNYFKVSTEPGGVKVDITGAGTGTHSFTILGHVYYALAANDVDAAGVYSAWFAVTASSKTDTFPNDSNGIRVEISGVP